MKNNKTLCRRLQRWALLPLLAIAAVLMTPQDALAVAYITQINVKSSPGDDGYYVGGDVVKIELQWSHSVHVLTGGNTPYFTMEVGTKDYTVYHTSGNDGKHLQFEFTLGSDAASNDTDGMRVIANSLAGDIRDSRWALTRSANLEISGVKFSDHKVDTVKPTVSNVEISSNPGSDKAYKTNEKIQATVMFSETVKVTGTPQLTLKIGSANKTADYESGSNSKSLVFAYTVASGDTDTDGIELEADKLTLNGGTIKDVTEKSATLTYTALPADSDHKVDTTAPTVSSITITSDAGTDNTYVKDQDIGVQVTFSEKMWVSGTPQLTLKIGTSDKTADFVRGHNSKNLFFEYTVADGDNDTDGIEIEKDKLTLNGGTITDLPGNNATLTHAALSADSDHKVATSPPTVQSVTIHSTPNAVNTYKKGDDIHAKMTFSRDVVVTGTPQVTLTIGDEDKTATYTSGSGSMDLVFEYTVATGDTDTDGVSIGANTLALGKYITIKDTVGVAATLTHAALDDQASHKVDSTPPTVNSVGITSSTGDTKTYKKGDTIQVTVAFSEKMKVTGTPQLTLKIGNADRKANWASGDGSTSLVFQYTVGGTDTDTDGISIAADQLSLNGGKITDLPGNNATLTHAALNTDSDHKVDGILPTINDGDIHFHPATGKGWYKLGETIQFKVDFSEKVWVTGTPQLDVKGITPHADYKSGDGDTDLIFEYTVAAGDEDTDGIEIEANQLSLNGGTIKDYAENPAVLTHDALSPSTSYKVDGIVPTVSSLQIISTPANNTKTYTTGEEIQVEVTFSEKVWVTGTPQLNLSITTGDKLADYKSGSDSNKLVFEYTVVVGDEDKDGLSIDADQLSLNGGTIKDVGGNPATLTHAALAASKDHEVDTTGSIITKIEMTSTASSNNTYKIGETIQATMTFDEKVWVTGTPQLTLNIGTIHKIADYVSGSSTDKLLFEYTVESADADADGISIDEDQLSLNGGTMKNIIQIDAILTHAAVTTDHKIDGGPPRIPKNGISITSNAGDDKTYKIGDTITVRVTFSEDVFVTNTPDLTLKVGSTNKAMDYNTHASGNEHLIFGYVVAEGDLDTDGISIDANQLSLGSFTTIKDAAGNAAVLTHPALTARGLHKVDAVVPTVTTIAITSAAGSDKHYKAGDTLQTTVTFTESVYVTGTPQVTLKIGEAEKVANYTSGSGTDKLVFEYTVVTGDTDTDGVSMDANQLALNGATLKDYASNPATLTHPALGPQADHKVDTTAPSLIPTGGIEITSSAGGDNHYKIGEKIQISVTFVEKMAVSGTPQLNLKIGAENKPANYTRGAGTTLLIFEYAIATGDADTDGISMDADQFGLDSGTITDIPGNPAVLTHAALPTQPPHKVDGVVPTIAPNGIAITSTDPPYIVGKTIGVQVTFSEKVSVTGTPQLTLRIGTANRKANYTSGTESTELVFQYTVAEGDRGADGISIAANQLSFNDGTIIDIAGNPAALTHPALEGQSDHKVDAVAPWILANGINISSDAGTGNTYKAADNVHVTVSFSETVHVTNTPQLALKVGTEQRIAAYTTGTGTAHLVFQYTVAPGDMDTDGIEIGADKLMLNGGMIKDSAGNNATLTHAALPPQTSHKVDTTAPGIGTNGVAMGSTPSDGTYKTGNSIHVTVTFTEPVYVAGTPELTLKIGAANRTALYTTGSGTANLVFEYVVASGDTDTDGIEIAANQLTIPDGTVTITDAGGNPTALTHAALPPQPGHKVDSTTPGIVPNGITLISNAGADDFYIEGDMIQVRVTFSKTLQVTGTPHLTLKIGAANRNALYTSGSGTASFVFQYRVAEGDEDIDGIAIERDKLSLNDGTITDDIGNAAVLTHPVFPAQTSHKVDAVKPRVNINGITVTSTPKNNNTYRTGEKIQVTATFNEPVTVTGTPTLSLTIGTAYKTATYLNGTGTANLVFEYTVALGDRDTDGISIAANQLRVPPPTTIKDRVGNPATLTHNAVNAYASHAVNGSQQSVEPPPTVSSVSLTSTGPYRVGSNIEVAVATSEAITATGTPTLTLVVDATDKTAGYHRGSGSAVLVFRYTVVSGDTDANGVAVRINSLALAGGSLHDSDGIVLTLSHSGVADAGTAHIVDTTAPRIATTNGVAISSTPNNGTYTTGDTVEVTVRFTEVVNVSGTPQLTLTIGDAAKKANYTSGSGTTSLIFGYTVVSGDTDTDGISIEQNQLSFNGGTITDAVGNPAMLTHTALATQPSHKVDTNPVQPSVQQPVQALSVDKTPIQQSVQQQSGQSPPDNTNPVQQPGQQSVQSPVDGPSINSLAITSTGAPYGVGDTIEVQVTFSKLVKVSGTPQLTLTIGDADKKANYTEGSGTTALIFGYTIVSGDEDADGITIEANQLSLNDGTITDAAGNPATLTHPAVPTQGSQQMQQVAKGAFAAAGAFSAVQQSQGLSQSTRHSVDGVSPSISTIAITSTPGSKDTYTIDETVQVRVTFSETVTVTGTPQLTLKVGASDRKANYTTGTGTQTLVFGYTIASGDEDADGIEIEANRLARNGGTITDAAGNAADLTNTVLPTQTAHKVGAPPTDVPNAILVEQAPSINSVDNTLNPNPPELPDQEPTQQVDTTAPQVSSLAFTSTGPYTVGDVIKITVTTSENVTVTGTPRIPIVMGAETQYAGYVSGSGTTALVFEYPVAAGDADADGVEILENALEHDNGSTIKSHYQTDLDLSHASLPADTKHSVDTAQPAMTADTEHIVDTAQPVTTADTNPTVDTALPVVTGVAFAEDAPTVYTAGSTVEVIVTFAGTGIKVTPDPNGAVPSLSLLFGANTDPDSQKTVVTANYKETRPGSTELVFTYTVTADTPIDTDGVQIQASGLKIPAGAAITDANENAVASTPTADGSSFVDIKPESRLSSRPILPTLTSASIVFNEFFNAKTDKHDWVELRNTTEDDISLEGWKLDISAENAAQTESTAFPETTLPGGGVLLLMNTAHKENHLERSDADTYRSLEIPELLLRDSDFSLMLRDGSGAIVDVLSNAAANTGFQQDEAYLREQPSTPGYEAAAWQPSGYQGGLGYDRKAPKATSLGTPGYPRSTLTPQAQTPKVNISEVMFATGKSGRLPQWIELYNPSKTEVVTLQGWQLQVEMADPSRHPTHRLMTFPLQKTLRILPNQTVLVVAKNGRNSQHFPEPRLYTLTEQHPEEVAPLGTDVDLLGTYGYAIVLRDAADNLIDIAGNLDGDGTTSDAPRWKLPNCMTPTGFRTSIIRQYEEGVPLAGTKKSSWFRATEIRRQIITYYGHPKDVGNPGWKKGGALPVQLSSFRAERTEQGAVIKWTTGSELENAGFNVLRSEKKTGPFQVVTPRMLQGAGTTSERSRYQHVDTTAKANVAYYYRLEEVSFSGVRQPIATRRLRGHVSAANRYLTTFGSLKKGE